MERPHFGAPVWPGVPFVFLIFRQLSWEGKSPQPRSPSLHCFGFGDIKKTSIFISDLNENHLGHCKSAINDYKNANFRFIDIWSVW